MNKKDLSKKLQENKKQLQSHMDRFNALRDQGKSKEALEELKIALSFASKTLQYSNSLLNNIHKELSGMPQEQKEEICKTIDRKTSKLSDPNSLINIHIPEKKIIH